MHQKERPLLVNLAGRPSDSGLGRTYNTKQAGETTDDQDVPSSKGHGKGAPFLAARAAEIPGDVRGRTVITEARETTDD